jgi:bacteriochlorophyllide a dehydrogenase
VTINAASATGSITALQDAPMNTLAVVMERPEHLVLRELDLLPAGSDDVVVDVAFSGISTGTERLLWSGRMPAFPGMGYPLVPGYESVGRISQAGETSGRNVGDMVFVPGSRGFRDARGLFGGAASRLVVAGSKVIPIGDELGASGVLLALAATAQHALAVSRQGLPELIVGHGVLGRLMARLTVAHGGHPLVWETNPERRDPADGYNVCAPENDQRRDYRVICDVSGAADLTDALIARLGHGGEVILAGFYEQPISFAFPAAFMREAGLKIAAEWKPEDLAAVQRLIAEGRLSLDGLITHACAASDAPAAYRTAFTEPACLKMILDWSQTS